MPYIRVGRTLNQYLKYIISRSVKPLAKIVNIPNIWVIQLCQKTITVEILVLLFFNDSMKNLLSIFIQLLFQSKYNLFCSLFLSSNYIRSAKGEDKYGN